MLSAMALHGREISQDLNTEFSQNTVANFVQTFKKDGTATISQRCPGRPRKLTPRQECLLMRRVEEN